MAAMVVPLVAGPGPAAKAAQVTGPRAASPSADVYMELDDAQFCNHLNACGSVTLWLNKTTGYLHAEVSSNPDASSQHPPIPGSEVTLEASGYEDFRNVPYTWRAWVPASGSNDWFANTQDVFWSAPGVGWWWRACGYIGSGDGCTMNWKVTYSAQGGWQIDRYPPES
jgi:hypothetical protein